MVKADAERLRAHGRLPDRQWASLWDARLAATQLRARAMLSREDRAVALALG